MICPYCGGETDITGHPRRNLKLVVQRARRCLRCGERFLTEELYVKRYVPRRVGRRVANSEGKS